MNTKRVKTRRWLRKLRMFFYRIKSFFSKICQRNEAPATRSVLFEIRYKKLSSSDRESLRSHIGLLLLLGYRVTMTPLKEHISSEYLGRVSYWNGGKLEWQEYLQIRVEYVEKRQLVSLPIPRSTLEE